MAGIGGTARAEAGASGGMSSAEVAAVPAITVSGLGKRIDERAILAEVSFEIARGEFVAILGANGAGKSTLLKILATLLPPSEGEVRLLGRLLTRDSIDIRRKIGLVGHQAMLYRDLSARENLEFFGKLYGVERTGERAMALLEAVGLADRAGDAVKAFSRGMTQRVAIARALMHDPELILADEPFAGLDAPSAATLEGLLSELHLQGRTVLLVNHDIQQSLRLAGRGIVLRRGQVRADERADRLDAAAVLAEVGRA